MNRGSTRYLKAAFNARPLGMFVAPNWIGLVAFAMLGLLNPGFWVLGAGLELAYLFFLIQNERFRRYVDGLALADEHGREQGRLEEALRRVDREGRERYTRLSTRCQALLDAQPPDRAGLDVQADELGRLLWVYLKLLRARQTLDGVLREAHASGQDERNLARHIKELEGEREHATSADLTRALDGQIEIVRQRSERQAEARGRVTHIDAELERIEQQVELLREETALTASSDGLSRRIDTVSSSLNETVQWVREQEGALGDVDEILDEAPALLNTRRQAR